MCGMSGHAVLLDRSTVVTSWEVSPDGELGDMLPSDGRLSACSPIMAMITFFSAFRKRMSTFRILASQLSAPQLSASHRVLSKASPSQYV